MEEEGHGDIEHVLVDGGLIIEVGQVDLVEEYARGQLGHVWEEEELEEVVGLEVVVVDVKIHMHP
jgi:hypothetical protein